MIPKNIAGVKVGRGLSALAVGFILSGLIAVPAVFADTITDTLDNWSTVAGHSDGLVLDSTNPEFFYKDASRVKISDGSTVGSFYYHIDGITSFAAFVYYWQNLGSLEVYTSDDNVTWAPLTYTHSDPVATTQSGFEGWVAVRISAELPPGASYLAFTIHGGPAPQVWTPQIGQVAMETQAMGLSGPAGLSVVAASGKASLAWYPVKGASSYTIKRRTAASKVFHTVADGVKTTTYTDDGLTNSSKYYYAVTADTDKGATGESDEVLAVPKSDSVIMADPLTDWNLTSAHSSNLEFDKLLGTADCVRPSASTQQTLDYNLPGTSGFSVNLYSADADMNNDLTVESSSDGTNWSVVPTSLKLPAKAAPGLFAVVCTPSGKLPSGTNYLRFALGSGGSPAANPALGQLRITYAVSGPVKTAAAHLDSTHTAP